MKITTLEEITRCECCNRVVPKVNAKQYKEARSYWEYKIEDYMAWSNFENARENGTLVETTMENRVETEEQIAQSKVIREKYLARVQAEVDAYMEAHYDLIDG